MLRLATTVAIFAILVSFTNIPSYLKVIATFAIYLGSGGFKWFILVAKTFRRDMKITGMDVIVIFKFLKLLLLKKGLKDLFYEVCRKDENKLAFICGDTKRSLTFKEVEVLCNKIANVFHEAGYKKGDTVGLFMENRIDYIPIWIGLSMRGIITSCINFNLRGDSLKHCLEVCDCKGIIFNRELKSAVEDIKNEIKVEAFCFDASDDELPESWKRLDKMIESASAAPAPKDLHISLSDRILYVYTSGTTGLPKAVIWPFKKMIAMALIGTVYFRETDIIYNPLPLYHSNGLLMVSFVFFCGGTAVVKKKFSASRYMEDCCRFRVTVINYIGEICRYILSQPKSVFDEINSIRLAFGNGLRGSIWKEFKERFNIEQIIEFYASTEGNLKLHPNFTGKVGAVGFREVIFQNKALKLIKMNKETGEIERDENGIAIEVKIGEPGQLVGKITKIQSFDGYTDKEATQKKIGHDIFTKGDSVYLTGDMLVRDEEGYYYFHDRTGDTFRWKGETVSTNEVEGLISKVTQLTDVCVYGVEVPGYGGKAGMACILDPERQIDICSLPSKLSKVLPNYAQPKFVRLSSKLFFTETYKFQKNTLRKENFRPCACAETDQLFYYNKHENKYLTLNEDVYQRILSESVIF